MRPFPFNCIWFAPNFVVYIFLYCLFYQGLSLFLHGVCALLFVCLLVSSILLLYFFFTRKYLFNVMSMEVARVFYYIIMLLF